MKYLSYTEDLKLSNPIVSDAIPSPFCRFEMVEQALKWVNNEFENAGQKEGERKKALGIIEPNDYHRIISECLDVGMLFYYKEEFKDKCAIIEVGTNFQERQPENDNIYQKRFLNALQTFETSKSIFENMESLEILKWDGIVVGSTSPVSLFVAAGGVKERLENNRKQLPILKNGELFNKNKPMAFCERPSGFRQFVKDKLSNVQGMSDFKKYVDNCLDYYLNKKITADDLFEDYIVKAYHPIDTKKFKCFSSIGVENYFLPLKEEFFERFGLDAVENVVVEIENTEKYDGKPVINNKKIKLKYGGYEKDYLNVEGGERDDIKGEGEENGFQFSLSFFPFVKPNKDFKSTIALHTARIDVECKLLLCEKTEENGVGSVKDVNSNFQDFNKYDENSQLKSRHSVVEENYNLINLDIIEGNDHFSVFIVPKLRDLKEPDDRSELFNFSVDIGTTNTYITYNTEDNKTPKPFEVFCDNDDLFVKLYRYDSFQQNSLTFTGKDLGKVSALEFLPPKDLQIGNDEVVDDKDKVSFPIRTVVWKDSDRNPKCFDFIYESIIAHRFNLEFEKEFKWNATDAKGCFEVSIKQLVNLISNFVTLKGGKLNSLTTFYPISMEKGLKDQIKTIWDNWCKENNVIFRWVSESEAPMKMEKEIHERLGDRVYFRHNGVTIDIGGGSTDAAFYNENGEVVATTSFEFAVGEDFFAYLDPRKGTEIIKKDGNGSYKGIFGKEYYDTLFDALLDKNKNFADANSFLLSKTKCYSEALKGNERVKVVIYYFYAAILYHIAAVYKRCVSDNILPFVIVFSGNGSKILRQIKCEEFTNDFMKCCMNANDNKDAYIRTVFEENPKTVTAEGGLYLNNSTYIGHEQVLFPDGNTTMTLKAAYQTDGGGRKKCSAECVAFSEIFFNILKKYCKEESEKYLKKIFEDTFTGINGGSVTEFDDDYEAFLNKILEQTLIGINGGPVPEEFFDEMKGMIVNDKGKVENTTLSQTKNTTLSQTKNAILSQAKNTILSQTTFFFPIKGVIIRALRGL